MDDKQKNNLLYLYSKSKKLTQDAKKTAKKTERARINQSILDVEKRISSIMNSLSGEDWQEADALLRKERGEKTAKRARKKTPRKTRPEAASPTDLPEPIKAIQERFLSKGLLKGFQKMKSSNVNYYQMEAFINDRVQDALSQGRIGEVLSLIYESGRTFNLEIISLLRELYRKKDYPTFLKHAHRFNVYSELKDEIEEVIKWHHDTNKPDAFAWRVKFDSIAQDEMLSSEPDSEKKEYVKICEKESIESKELVTLKITPIYRKGVKTNERPTEDTEKYIQVQYNKTKLDQANASHRETQTTLEAFLDIFSVPHSETKHIDVFADINGIPHIFEVKSITLRNEGTQTREAVGQLHEYAYLYGLDNPRYYLVYSSKPETDWLIHYLEEREKIDVIWIDETQPHRLSGPGLKALEQECLRFYKKLPKD